MKKILLIAFVFLNLKTFGQDMIYLTNGNSVPGKIIEITKDSVKFKNLSYGAWPVISYPIAKVQFAFNSNGNCLIFEPSKAFNGKEKDEFIKAQTKPRPFDIVVDLNGKLSTLIIASETESKISDGKANLNKDSLAFVIRKSGDHELFCAYVKALPYLIKYKLKIDSLFDYARITPNIISKPDNSQNDYIVPDMALFARRAFKKIQDFNERLKMLVSGDGHRLSFGNFIGWGRANLFLSRGEKSHVEVMNLKTKESNKYLLSEYLNTIINKRRQFDKLDLEYVNVDYATKFRVGIDGNYYGTVTFVQKMKGFKDGNLVYCNKMRVNFLVALPPYSGPDSWGYDWDVYLDDIGIEETEKL